jgi:hypothetical protein
MLAGMITIADEEGRFKGALSLPGGTAPGRYVLQALSTTEKETLVGSTEVYLGLPQVEMLCSTPLVWLSVSLILWVRLARRRHSHQPGDNPRSAILHESRQYKKDRRPINLVLDPRSVKTMVRKKLDYAAAACESKRRWRSRR